MPFGWIADNENCPELLDLKVLQHVVKNYFSLFNPNTVSDVPEEYEFKEHFCYW